MTEQLMMDAISDDLMKQTQSFVDLKNEIMERKTLLEEIKTNILAEMIAQNREHLTVTVGGENYFFEVKRGEDDLRCVKQTRTPVPSESEL